MPTYNSFPTTVIGPTYPIAVSLEPRVIKVDYGDGYTQETPNGINYMLRTFNLTWEVLTLSEKTTIETFLLGQGGYMTFQWVAPDTNTYKVKCRKWTFSSTNPNTWSLQCDFNEVPR